MAESMKRFGGHPSARDEDQLHIAQFLLDHLDAMVAYWDTNEVCVYANNAYRLWFGKSKEQVIGHTLRELLGPIYPLNAPYIRAALEGRPQIFEREIPTPAARCATASPPTHRTS